VRRKKKEQPDSFLCILHRGRKEKEKEKEEKEHYLHAHPIRKKTGEGEKTVAQRQFPLREVYDRREKMPEIW